MKFSSRAPLKLCKASILITTFLALVSCSGAVAADLQLFEGTWMGTWKRTSGLEEGSTGELITEFTIKNNQLEGTHYNIKMENVEVEGRVATQTAS